MRRELNAAQSPLTMSNCAQSERAGSRFGCSCAWVAFDASPAANKKPLPWAGVEERGCSWLIGSEAEEFGRNSIQAVVAHHLEDDVDQHSSDVEGSHQSQASPEFFSCCWGLIVGPGAGSVGHRLIATSITLAKEFAGVQQSSLTFTSARFEIIGEHQGK